MFFLPVFDVCYVIDNVGFLDFFEIQLDALAEQVASTAAELSVH